MKFNLLTPAKNYVLCVMLFLPVYTHGQSVSMFATEKVDNKLAVRWTVLPLIDIYDGSAVVLGIEHKVYKNIALSYDAGTYFANFNGINNTKGLILRGELKYYVSQDKYTNGIYASLAFFYKHQSYVAKDSIKIQPMYYQKEYMVEKDVTCLTLKMGYQDITPFRLLLDFYGGLGVRYKRTSNTLTVEENAHIKSNGDYSINVARNQAVDQFTLNIELGVRIGFSIIR